MPLTLGDKCFHVLEHARIAVPAADLDIFKAREGKELLNPCRQSESEGPQTENAESPQLREREL
jgi:Flp pilus assembly CpaE family ATPase